jgi:hypothetical protein
MDQHAFQHPCEYFQACKLAIRCRTNPNTGQSKRRAVYLNSLVFVASFIFMRPLITLVYVFIEHSKAVKGEAGPAPGYVTVETWACALSRGGESSTARSLCTELHAACVVLIPIFVLSCVQLALVVWYRVVDFKEERAERMSSVSGVEPPAKGAGFAA